MLKWLSHLNISFELRFFFNEFDTMQNQGHVMTEMGHIAYHWIRLAKTNVKWRLVTSGDLKWPLKIS